jgi:hypothetical protein
MGPDRGMILVSGQLQFTVHGTATHNNLLSAAL